MLIYPGINHHWKNAQQSSNTDELAEYLMAQWIRAYKTSCQTTETEIIETHYEGYAYLFDIQLERLIAAWGITQGKNQSPRDASRMQGSPLGAGEGYHRGHAIPHSMGGGLDINLVPQRGALNIGQFRVLENRAVKTSGSFYFTYWEYAIDDSQKPSAVQQGLLCPREEADIRWFEN